MAEPGVSRELAEERARRVSDLRYELELTLHEDPAAPIDARVRLTFRLSDSRAPLAIDFAPDHGRPPGRSVVNDRAWDAALDNEHLVIPAALLRDGVNEVILPFVAGNVPLNRRPGLTYSIFVPARARETFPCLDQPSLRGRFSLTLNVPDVWTAVSNAALAGASNNEGRRTFAFAATPPLPTYLFAFAAGRLLEDVAERDGREFRIYYTASETEAYLDNREALVEGHAHALRWLEEYTDTRYPFGKFDVVLVPAFQFGGMEHPGAVFYNASTVLLPSSATRQQRLARASVIAHETAHMWFGDLVTMTWFDDVWMKEVFANFMAAKIVEPSFADVNHELRFLHTHYPAAYDVDRTAGAHPVRQPLVNLSDAGSLYGAIVYLKSPFVMRQLELLLGTDGLRTALREYLARHAFASASWPDLLSLLQRHTNHDLSAWSESWLESAGRPVIETALSPDDSGASRIDLRCHSSHAQRLDVALGSALRIDHATVWLQRDTTIPVDRGAPAPEFVLPNGRGLGYGDFILDRRSRDWLTHRLWDVPESLTRGSAWLTMWDAMLAERRSPLAYFDLGVAGIDSEASELNLQRILNDIERTFWLFLSDQERHAASTRLEAALQLRLDRQEPVTAKAAVFASMRAVATTNHAVDWLRALWSDDVRIDGLTLREADYVALTQELAVRSANDDGIVERQLARTGNEDRRSALAFVAPALSVDPAARQRFFSTISTAANRRREPWVIDGLRWLHHPLRAKASVVFLGPGLELLEDVKRTGDIFLPKRWLDAMFSGHRSPEAAQIVRVFLDGRPDTYPIALRRMILASADHLFRVEKTRHGGGKRDREQGTGQSGIRDKG
jgi:aminopeptidase N